MLTWYKIIRWMVCVHCIYRHVCIYVCRQPCMGIYVLMWGHRFSYYTYMYSCINVCICMYAISMYILRCVYRQKYIGMCPGIHLYMYIHRHITYIMHANIHVYVCLHIGIHVCSQTYMGIHLCMYVCPLIRILDRHMYVVSLVFYWVFWWNLW